MEAFELEGYWWLPGREDARVPGFLSFDPAVGAELRLIGALRPFTERVTEPARGVTVIQPGSDSGRYERVHGEAAATAVTLVDCFRTRITHSFFDAERETIYVSQIVQGAWFDEGEVLAATELTARIRNLTHWRGVTGLRERFAFAEAGPDEADPVIAVEVTRVPDVELLLSDGTSLRIGQVVGTSGDSVTERRINQAFVARIEPPALAALHDLREIVHDIQDIVAIGADSDAPIEGLTFRHPDATHGDSHRFRELSIFTASAFDGGEARPIRHHEMLFTLADLGGAEGLARWLDTVATLRRAVRRTVASRHRTTDMFVGDRLLNRAAALESLDRKRSGASQSRFVTRMKRCAAFAGPPFEELVGDVDRWATVFTAERDEAAHALERGQLRGSPEVLYIADSAYWLFVLCILRLSNAPEALVDQMLGHRRVQWLTPNIRSVVADSDATDPAGDHRGYI